MEFEIMDAMHEETVKAVTAHVYLLQAADHVPPKLIAEELCRELGVSGKVPPEVIAELFLVHKALSHVSRIVMRLSERPFDDK